LVEDGVAPGGGDLYRGELHDLGPHLFEQRRQRARLLPRARDHYPLPEEGLFLVPRNNVREPYDLAGDDYGGGRYVFPRGRLFGYVGDRARDARLRRISPARDNRRRGVGA